MLKKKMCNKFKNKEVVIVNGFGKCDNKHYNNEKAIIICRDSYYHDYNVRFENGTEDWIDAIFLIKLEKEK